MEIPTATSQLPLSKIKRIMKEDDETKIVGAEVNFVMAMATVSLSF
jgi:Histone-like transcription factor (CBF/NF-Y) and archaeal histone